MTTIFDTEPSIISNSRTVAAEWKLPTPDDKELFAVLTVTHFGRPHYAYKASLNIEELDTSSPGFTARGFFPFDAVRVAMEGGAKRRSDKAMREFLTAAIEDVREMAREGQPEIVNIGNGVRRNS